MKSFQQAGTKESLSVQGGSIGFDLIAIGLIGLFAFGIAPAFIRRLFGR